MQAPKKKDELTDLVEILDDGYDDSTPNNGDVLTSEGERVRLDFKVLARKLLNVVTLQKKNKDIVAVSKKKNLNN